MTLRAAALDAIDHRVSWIPAWGHDRIYNMVVNRPDWCISRQRAWECRSRRWIAPSAAKPSSRPALVEQAAKVFETYGADAWYERPIEEFVPAGLTCPNCGGIDFRARDEHPRRLVRFGIEPRGRALDAARADVAGRRLSRRQRSASRLVPELAPRRRSAPAAAPPFQEVITHGFLIDVDGTQDVEVARQHHRAAGRHQDSGADILRLWVVDERLPRGNPRRKGNPRPGRRGVPQDPEHASLPAGQLSRLHPGTDSLPIGQLEEVDRYILARYSEVAQRILRAYDEYDYGTIFQAINAFTTVDLSAFYADVSKDRLYTFAARSRERRSAQTALCIMADGLTRLAAPILSFTADELWRFLPGTREESVHIALFPERAELATLADAALLERWETLTNLRQGVCWRS